MTEKQLREWLESYGRAWEGRDPDAAACGRGTPARGDLYECP